ncbi:unnamed protein product [Leptidea sinapis]|uniref:C2H2-type domain-containing protein n=1 Tax=Leptidea sinapis TaxID=189913 RepID=A0A5E4R8R1_9NEOP|nr:unnamed protein product [Leptidea sinapis]
METIVKIEREDEPEDNIDTETSVAIKTEPDDDTEINVSSDCKIPETLISNDESGDKKSSKPIKMESVLNVECVIAEDKKLEVNDYAYSALSQIEIVTITEEERQIEFQELYESRKHMNHICNKCAIGYVIKEAYDMHMKMHSPESGSYVCSLCDTYLKTEETLHRHKLRHYRRYRCMVCGVRYKDRDACAGHVSFSHAGTTFRCDQCTSEFKRPQYLKRHIEQMHLKANPMECPVCHQVFYESGWFRNHVSARVEASVVSGVPPSLQTQVVPAPTPAGAPSRSGRDLPGVLRGLHQLASPRPALRGGSQGQLCRNQQVLTRHVKGHKGELYPCTECGRTFRTQSYVKVHYQIVHLHMTRSEIRRQRRRKLIMVPDAAEESQQDFDEEFPCVECGKTFKTQSYVKVHYNMKHRNMSREEAKRRSKELNVADVVGPRLEQVFVKTEPQEALAVPMFETFVDIQRELVEQSVFCALH